MLTVEHCAFPLINFASDTFRSYWRILNDIGSHVYIIRLHFKLFYDINGISSQLDNIGTDLEGIDSQY